MTKKTKKSNNDNVIQFPMTKIKSSEPPISETIGSRPPDFAGFAIAVANNRVNEAGEILSLLLNIAQDQALSAASHYIGLYQTNRRIHEKAMCLRSAVEENKTNESLLLLYEIFNLQGPIAITALDSLKKRV